MGFWAPSAPAVPDYQALAQQQASANEQATIDAARLNHPNQVTPYGNQTWTVDPNDPLQWTVTNTLSDPEQQKLDLQNNLALAMLQGGQTYGIPDIMNALNTNFTPPRQAQLGWENDYAPDQRLQTESGMYEAPWIQEGLDFSGAPAVPTPDSAMRQQMADTLYQMGSRYLDPQYQQAQEQLDSKLSNQGIFLGSDAYKDAEQNFADQKARDYGNLRDSSLANSGAEMANQFNMGAQAHQIATGDITQQGTFANQARSQLISELLNDMQARNSAIVAQGNIANNQQNASNQGTQAWLSQTGQAATLPVNIIEALMNGGQVNNPQWQPFSANAEIAPAPIFQGGIAQYQANLNNANLQNANTANWLSFGSKLGTGFLPFSGLSYNGPGMK